MRAYRITVPEQNEDLAVALLWEAGTAGIDVRTGDATGRARRAVLLAYFEDDASPEGLRDHLVDVTIETTPVPDVDWVARFRESFRSFRVGGFVVAPPWDLPATAAGTHTLIVDPGRAFGTGTHETTRLCLAALEERAERGTLGRVLDVGAGTGILAVAAAHLGAPSVTATDIDPEAVAVARAHARLNGVRLHIVRADGVASFRPGTFELVLANLTAPLVKALATDMKALLASGGALVLSGLLESDLPEVEAAFESLGRPAVRREGEWAALVCEAAP
jgi:ribosomal protein L11 methyltransferase